MNPPEVPDATEILNDERTWTVYIEVTPSPDGRFFKMRGQVRKADNRVPTVISTANTTDLIFEKIEGEMKNALRLIVNDIQQQVITPGRNARRGK